MTSRRSLYKVFYLFTAIPAKQKELTTKESSKQTKKGKKKKEKSKKDKKDVDKGKRKDSTTKDTEQNTSKVPENVEVSNESPQKITKKINDLIITVPQQATRKIKLNRNKVTVSVSKDNNQESNRVVNVAKSNENNKEFTLKTGSSIIAVDKCNPKDKIGEKNDKKDKTKKKKRKKRVSADKDSDHDEITLQLSDTEKMDLLEDFDRKKYDVVSSSSSEDSDSSADSECVSNNSENTSKDTTIEIKDPTKVEEVKNKLSSNEDSLKNKSLNKLEENNEKDSENTATETEKSETVIYSNKNEEVGISETNYQKKSPDKRTEITGFVSETVNKNVLTIQNIDDIPIMNKESETDSQDTMEEKFEISKNEVAEIDSVGTDNDSQVQKHIERQNSTEILKPDTQDTEKNLSEGELSEHDSSEIEALDLKPEVVCISDDEKGSGKKKKKKDKKKKDKKSNKKDFRQSADENFYKNSECLDRNITSNSIDVTDNLIENTGIEPKNTEIGNTECSNIINDDVYEILELSDDSSCYEVEGTVLSKEPTVEEIAALSAKIDEIGKEEREEVITEEQIKEFERKHDNSEADDNIENISWKDRYLDSKKVKKVLSTSNILNALRKKNKELKNKLEEKRKHEEELKQREKENEAKEIQKNKAEKELVEGSIGHYNTLQGSTKYVDPVKEMEKTEINELKWKRSKCRKTE